VSWDTALLLWINRGLAHPVLDCTMVTITYAAMPVVALLPAILWLRGHRREANALSAILVLSLVAALGCQFLLDRPRPGGVRLVLPMPRFPSFPSGHAASTFAYALFVALARRRATIAAWIGAIGTACSRIYLGHHYPSDVLGGALVGLAAGAMVYGMLYQREHSARPRWAWLLWGQLALVLIAILGAYLRLLNLWVFAVPGVDKVLHLVLFGALAFTAVGWWAHHPAGLVLGILGTAAAVEEALQSLSATRSFDLLDLATTLLGILVFGCLSAALLPRPAGKAKTRSITDTH
jgi:undecaprenyl-diphosphatase